MQSTEPKEQRTLKQNSSLHKWCELLADSYNENGLTMQAIINKYTTDIMPTPHSVKEIIIKHIIKQAFGYDSTTELKKTQEIDKVIDMVNMLNAKMGIEYVPFPSEEHEQDELKDLINENNK